MNLLTEYIIITISITSTFENIYIVQSRDDIHEHTLHKFSFQNEKSITAFRTLRLNQTYILCKI